MMSEEKRPEWMESISGIVNPEDYLLGRKIDKTFELSQEEKAQRAREARAELIANNKIILAGDPILELARRREQLKLEIIQNPIKLRQLREKLLREEREQNQPTQSNNDRREPREESRREHYSSRSKRDSPESSKRRHYSSRSRKLSPDSPRRGHHSSRSRKHSPEVSRREYHSSRSRKYSPESSRRHHYSSRSRHGSSRDKREEKRETPRI